MYSSSFEGARYSIRDEEVYSGLERLSKILSGNFDQGPSLDLKDLPLEVQSILELNRMTTGLPPEVFVQKFYEAAKNDFDYLRNSIGLDFVGPDPLVRLLKTYLIIQTMWGHARERHGKFKGTFRDAENNKIEIQVTPGLITWVLFGNKGYEILSYLSQAIIDMSLAHTWRLVQDLNSEKGPIQNIHRYDYQTIESFLSDRETRRAVFTDVLFLNDGSIDKLEEEIYEGIGEVYNEVAKNQTVQDSSKLGPLTYVLTSLALRGKTLGLIPLLFSEKEMNKGIDELRKREYNPSLLLLAGLGYGGIQDTWEDVRDRFDGRANKAFKGTKPNGNQMILGGGANVPLNLESLVNMLRVRVEYNGIVDEVLSHFMRAGITNFTEPLASLSLPQGDAFKYRDLRRGPKATVSSLRRGGLRDRTKEAVHGLLHQVGNVIDLTGIFGLNKGEAYLRKDDWISSYIRYLEGRGISDEWALLSSYLLFGILGFLGTAVADLIDTLSKFSLWNPSYDFDELMGWFVLHSLKEKGKLNILGNRTFNCVCKGPGWKVIKESHPFFPHLAMAAMKIRNGENGEEIDARNDCSVRRLAEIQRKVSIGKEEHPASAYRFIQFIAQKLMVSFVNEADSRRISLADYVKEKINSGVKSFVKPFDNLKLGFSRVQASLAIRQFLSKFVPDDSILGDLIDFLFRRSISLERENAEGLEDKLRAFLPSLFMESFLTKSTRRSR